MKHGWASLELIEKILDKLGGQNGAQRFLYTIKEHVINVNYDLSLTEAMLAGHLSAGDFEVNDANFPTPGGGVVQVTMSTFSFKGLLTIEEKLAEMCYLGFRPATVFELIAFFTQMDFNRAEHIALGSVISPADRSGNYCISNYHSRLNLRWIGSCCLEHFLVIREK